MVKRVLIKTLTVTILILSGCTTLDLDNLGNLNYNPSLVIPIGSFHTSIMDLIKNVDSTNVKVDAETNTLYILYEEPENEITVINQEEFAQGVNMKYTVDISQLDEFHDIINSVPGNWPYDYIPLEQGKYKFKYNTTYSFGYNKGNEGDNEITRIDHGNFKTAVIQIKIQIDGITVSSDNPLDITFRFPGIKIDEQEYQLHKTISTNNIEIEDLLNDFYIQFLNATNSETRMYTEFNLNSNGNAKIYRDAKIQFTTQFKFVGFNSLFGYIYEKDPLINDNFSFSIPTDFFQTDFQDNKLLFRDPQIAFKFRSNIGIPITLQLDSIFAENTDGTRVDADFNGSSSIDINLNTPDADSQIGEFVTTTETFNRDNGATHKLFSIIPENINCTYKVFANHKDDGKQQFLVGTPTINVGIAAKIPLVFDTGTKFSYQSTLPLDIESSLNMDAVTIDALNLYFEVSNSLPVETNVKLIFKDSDGNVTHEGEKTIQSSIVDESGKTQQPFIDKDFSICATGETMENILRSAELTYEVTISDGAAKKGIYLQTTDAIDLKISAFAKAKATIDTETAY